MELGDLLSKGVRFPGAAGAAQDAGRMSALAAELGGSYEQYHGFLNSKLAATLADLEPAPATPDAYAALVATELAVYSGEVLLRMCRALVLLGRPLSEGPLMDGPIAAKGGGLAAGPLPTGNAETSSSSGV